MPDSPCLARVRSLFDAIEARAKGTQVSGAGGKGRSVSYANTSLDDMIRLYRQLWSACPDAKTSDLPLLNEPGTSTVERGMLRVRAFR